MNLRERMMRKEMTLMRTVIEDTRGISIRRVLIEPRWRLMAKNALQICNVTK
jgi:hypothetical protein